MEANEIRRRVTELGPWYQNIDLGDGITTKNLDGGADIFAGHDIPAPLWRAIAPDLGDLTGHNVLDIGCNAGYMSFEAKRRGAARVLGVDSNLGATTSFLDQAEFCREILGLDVEFREISFFDMPPEPFHTILFCGVLYHLENWATGLDKLLELAAPGAQIILETASEPITQTTYGTGYHGDTTTFFVPSMSVLLALVRERGLHVEVARDLGTRALLHLRAPGG
jgi:2-polyprenyl-3-methyl-5-hydroxy-6-metoxy-1,4-benzoquinol methylase